MAKRKKLHFFIVDDDKTTIDIYTQLLEQAGHQVSSSTSSIEACKKIIESQPDCVLSDLTMPNMDGFDLFHQLRLQNLVKQPIFIIITGKLFKYDQKRAYELGIEGYLNKPIKPETFISDILDIINHTFTIQFWGVRGTLPVPGRKTVRYGGNTNCVTLNFAKRQFFIFDAGTGIKELSNHLLKENNFPMTAKLFFSHPHYDHINGVPFFVPFYMPGNEFEILGTSHHDLSIEKLFAGQMDSIYFPITIKEFAAKLQFRNLKEESFQIDKLNIQTILLNHPGRCLGYRVQYQNKVFCYVTDTELYLEDSPQYNQHEETRLIEFIKSTNMLVIDTTYMDDEYNKKIGWGHSCVSRIVDIADRAKVKTLCLYHHDPDQYDNDIDMKLKFAKQLLKDRKSKTKCIAPKEGDKFSF